MGDAAPLAPCGRRAGWWEDDEPCAQSETGIRQSELPELRFLTFDCRGTILYMESGSLGLMLMATIQ